MQTIDKSSELLRLNHLDDWAVPREVHITMVNEAAALG